MFIIIFYIKCFIKHHLIFKVYANLLPNFFWFIIRFLWHTNVIEIILIIQLHILHFRFTFVDIVY